MSILNYFKNLYREHKQITLLSLVYAVIAIISVFIAGIFALINQNLGISMLVVPGVAMLALIANIVVWALIKLLLDAVTEKTESKEEKNKTEKKR